MAYAMYHAHCTHLASFSFFFFNDLMVFLFYCSFIVAEERTTMTGNKTFTTIVRHQPGPDAVPQYLAAECQAIPSVGSNHASKGSVFCMIH